MTKTERMNELKGDLIKGELSIQEIFDKHLNNTNTFLFESVLKDLSKEIILKRTIAETFEISDSNIFIVGSSKLGFSLNPKNLFRQFDEEFIKTSQIKDKSDLDIAIVSPDLFNRLNKSLYLYTKAFKNKWGKNEIYYGRNLKDFDVPLNYKFHEYHTKGWFRSDMKPRGFEFCQVGNYENLKSEIINITNRKPGIAIYKDEFFFIQYHLDNLKYIQNLMKSTIL